MRNIHRAIALMYAASVSLMAGGLAIYYAGEERGYFAVGGEFFLFPAVFIAAYKVMNFLFKRMEEEESADQED